MRKLSIVVLCTLVMLCTVLASCSKGDVIATVNGQEITEEEFKSFFDMEMAQYGLTYDSLELEYAAGDANQYKNYALETMANRVLMLQYAKEQGLDTLTAEETDGAAAQSAEYLQAIEDAVRSDVEAEAQADSAIDVEAEARTRYETYVEMNRLTPEWVQEVLEEDIILERVYTAVMEDFAFTEADLEEYYGQKVSEQQEAAESGSYTVAEYESALAEAGELMLYVPQEAGEDARFVKHILIAVTAEASEEISQAEADGDTGKAEELREQALEEIKPKAEQVTMEALQGADFEQLITEYNEDPGMEYYPNGYFVYEGASFVESFLDASFALKESGDITEEPVASDYGYHIIRYYSKADAGPVPYEEVKEALAPLAEAQAGENFWWAFIDRLLDGSETTVNYFGG